MLWEIVFLVLFFGAGLGLVHTYFMYPLTLKLWALFSGDDESEERGDLKSVALIIAAYNEEDVIAEKIENSLELAYPDELLNIVVFSDASDDRTDEIVKQYENQGVSLVRIEGRVGKTECQNRVVDLVDEDIIVFSDANSMYESDAITNLVRGFSSQVGCVVGELRYRESSDVEGESFYWQYESWIKRLESRFYSLVTGNGSIYAVKSESYVPQPPGTISDFTEPLSIIRNGERVKYVPSAVAWEETSSSTSEELQRRIRIVTRCWNSIAGFPDLLNPIRDPRFAYQLWSHKILRWLSPVLLGVVLVANVGLVAVTSSVVYQVLLAGQISFYLLAGVGWVADRLEIDSPLIAHVPFYFLQANYGMLHGLLNFLQRKNIVVWETSSRTDE
ncbi:glycosyltransferase family 2 protein [Natronorubrum tibetense]|uniref:Glycosyl transferase family protein n=1 Tax=Natronorubrum tibetense GA33 TaxID=1114856 RepID=L9W8G2_9EURY|nr:glycosyltransferase family 2 protein [Natronorubrum tibetense]ELY45774.1 glycosyl transferase family protein [Natronorubrum tibetense GA33]